MSTRVVATVAFLVIVGCGHTAAVSHPGTTSSAAVATVTAAPATTAPTTTAVPATTTTPATGVVTAVLHFVDHTRPTVSHGRRLAAERSLPTTVWYPSGPPKGRPLLVFAHGYRVGVAPYRRVCLVWAERGFVVAAPSFPLTDQSAAGSSLDESDLVNQPADVSFVITQLLAQPGLVDPAAIAVAGHSDGADTALAVGYLPGMLDHRIRAVIADAPDPLPRPAGAPPLASTVPLLLVHGDRDTVAPFTGSQQVEAQLRAPGWFLVLRGADHLEPIQGPSPWTPVLDRVSSDFLTGTLTSQSGLPGTLTADVMGAPAKLLALEPG